MPKLVWFQHVHKAAGTTVVALAQANGQTLHPGHKNGSPPRETGRLWEFDPPQLSAFIDRCFDRGITFVATEHGLPDVEFIKRRYGSDVFLYTVIRDPFERFVSNYLYSRRTRIMAAVPVEQYYGGRALFTQPNYYAKLFSRMPGWHVGVGIEPALRLLAHFDRIAVCENPGFTVELAAELQWPIPRIPSQNAKTTFDSRVRSFLSGADRALRAIESSGFRERFVTENAADYSIYNLCRRIETPSELTAM